MGYTTLLDILGAFFIAGILLLSLQQIGNNTVINLQYYTKDYTMQRDLAQLISQIERDFKRIGYTTNSKLIKSTAEAITQANDTSITIVGDFDDSGTVQSIKYYIGPVSELSSTYNPNDRILYRKVGASAAQKINYNVTYFHLDYYDSFDKAITTPVATSSTGSIATIQIYVRLQSPDVYKTSLDTGKYTDLYWRQMRVTAKNLKNR
jgi:type II secretory pathway component PulJ